MYLFLIVFASVYFHHKFFVENRPERTYTPIDRDVIKSMDKIMTTIRSAGDKPVKQIDIYKPTSGHVIKDGEDA